MDAGSGVAEGDEMRVLIGSLIQESNTFSPSRSSLQDFYQHHWVTGEEVRSIQTQNELWGFMRKAEEEGVAVVPVLSANAVSSGMLAAESFRELKIKLRTLLQAALQREGGFDGVYFALHGAMVAEDCDDTEGELLTVIRDCVGPDLPLVISLDLHANLTERMARQVNGLIGFRTYPHIDFAETGSRAASLLFAAIRGEVQPVVKLVKLPMIVPAENSQSTHGPFAELWEEARAGEEKGDVLVTSLFPVQPWLDIDEMGSSVVVVGHAGKEQEAVREAERLAGLFWEKREAFGIELFTVRQVIGKLREHRRDEGPIVISDSADSPSAGSLGDSNAVLKELLEQQVQLTHRCLVTLVDAPAVHKAITAGVGQETVLSLGGSLHESLPQPLFRPIEVSGLVRRIGDGRFYLKNGYAKNTEAFMGRCVVFDIGWISVLITERATFSGDPAMYRSMGLEPSEAELVQVKSANQFRAEYGKLTPHIYMLDSPGYSQANLMALAFRKLVRPFYPLDEVTDWKEHPLYGTKSTQREDDIDGLS
ncbi:M81 family metallopeptidase [Paenibacillus sp. GD4]|uniref:M81 family metallopeptidase n=1 Tax=Paenibacillus sp. GD4 TaxID=3068890 RepID=UPI0027964CA8|nr:M81 family metallopeptidase [Paenibacillus sp. GD4]MDQ1909006.1 M81 family metallopeptidase [Paenibacillus sp. GD4]